MKIYETDSLFQNLSKNEYNFEYSYRNLMQVPFFLQICSSQAQNGGSDDARTVRINTSYTTCELGAPGYFSCLQRFVVTAWIPRLQDMSPTKPLEQQESGLCF